MSDKLTPAQIAASILLEIEAVLIRPQEPFTFTSGRKSPVYVDCRKIIGFPRARARLMDMGVEALYNNVGHEAFDVVAGGETAGIPFAAFIAERMSLPMAYIRKKPKGFGRDAQIEGVIKEGDRVLLVEDLATDGGSKLNFVNAIRTAGAQCDHTFVVFHYGIFPEGIKKLSDEGVTLHGLTTWWDVIALAEEKGYVDEAGAKIVRDFLDNPDKWNG
jgi:orotate phosphoribosyltransferase